MQTREISSCRVQYWSNQLVFLLVILLLNGCNLYGDDGQVAGRLLRWEKLDEGLSLKEFLGSKKTYTGESKITVLKIDPKIYDFKLLIASELNETPLTPKQWAKKYGLTAAINAGMYQKDRRTNVGFMKNYSYVNNPRIARSYKAILAFNRKSKDVPIVQIIDTECQDFNKLMNKYNTFLQNLRLINCDGKNVWKKQPNTWSMAVLATDKSGNVLMVFSPAAQPVYEFINVLLSLPVSINRAMYLEGGKETSLFVSTEKKQVELSGISSSFYVMSDPWPIPNVIGIVKKK